MNHSCLPNAKAFKRDEVKLVLFFLNDLVLIFFVLVQDKDGHVIILALGPIVKGEEVNFEVKIAFLLVG